MKKRLNNYFYFFLIFFVISPCIYISNATNEQRYNNEIESSVFKKEYNVFNRVNSIRAYNNLRPLVSLTDTNTCMTEIQKSRIKAYIEFIQDNGPSGAFNHQFYAEDKSSFNTCNDINVLYLIAENACNVASGSNFDPVDMWVNSLKHKRLILNPSLTHVVTIEHYDQTIKEYILIQLFFELKKT